MRLLRALFKVNTVLSDRKVRWHEPFHLHRLVARAKNRSWIRQLSLSWLLWFGVLFGTVLIANLPERPRNSPLDSLGLTAYLALALACICVLIERLNPHTVCITEQGIWIDGPGFLVKKCKISKLTIARISEMPFLRIAHQSNESIVGIPEDLPTNKLAEKLRAFGYQIEHCSNSSTEDGTIQPP